MESRRCESGVSIVTSSSIDDAHMNVQYSKGTSVLYRRSSQCPVVKAVIIDVHMDDNLVPYYTIKLPNGKEKQTVNAHITIPDNDTKMDVNHDEEMKKKEVAVSQKYHPVRSSNRKMTDPPGFLGKKNPLYQSIPIPTSNGPPLVSRRRRVSKDSLNTSSSSLSSLDSSLHDMEIVVLSLAKDVQKSNKQVGLLLKQMQTLEQEQKKINDRTRRSSTPDSLDVYRKEWESEMEKLDQSFRSSCSSKSNKQRVSFSSLDDSMSSSSRTMPSMLLDESIGSNHSSRRKSIDTQNPSMLDQLISNDKKKDRRRRFGRK